jgi:hypothetical protein
MEKYKLSKYNFFIDSQEGGAIYNAISNEIFSIGEELFGYLKKSDETIDNNVFDEDLIKYLYNNGIVVKESENVLESAIKVGILPVANIIYGLVGEEDIDFLSLLNFVASPQFRGNVYFTFRAFEIRVGSVISNKIIEDRENIVNRKSEYQNYFTPKVRSMLADIDIYWFAGDEYVADLLSKMNIINVFMNSQNMFLNTRRECIRRYDTYPVLKHIITLDKKPIVAINESDTICNLYMIQKQIFEGTRKGLTLNDILKEVYECLKLEMVIGDYDMDSVMSTLSETIIDNAIILTQKNIIKWK